MVRRLRQLFEKKEVKILANNFFFLSLLQVVNYVLPFITLPYLSRIIGVEKFGIIALSTAIMAYFTAFVDYGFNYTAVRDIAKNRTNLNVISKIYSNVMVARFFLLIISLIIFLLIINFIPLLHENRDIMYFSFLMLPGYIMLPTWFFQAMEEMKYIAIFSTVSRLIFVMLIFIVIKEKSDYIFQPLLLSTGTIISGIGALIFIKKKFKIIFIIPSYIEIFTAIKKSTNMFICIFTPNLYSNITAIFLSSFYGNVATGIFDAGNKFPNVSQMLSNLISRVFYPFLSRKIDKHKYYNYCLFSVCLLMSISMFFGAELLIKIFYTSEFNDSVRVIKLMSITPILLYLSDSYGTNYLVLIGKEKTLRNIIVYCSLCGFIISYFLISNYSYVGACLTLIIVRGSMGILTYIYAKKFKI